MDQILRIKIFAAALVALGHLGHSPNSLPVWRGRELDSVTKL